MRGQIAWVTLNRPETLNALTVAVGRELREILAELAGRREVRVVVLTGAGRAFCSGIDLNELAELGNPREQVRSTLQEVFHPLVLQIRRLEKPVIAAVGGVALGLGCSLALAADHLVAGRSASFHVAFARMGLGVDGGTSALLTARIGHTRASQMALLAEPIGADQALRWGLINDVVDDDHLLEAATGTAARLASGSPGALAAIKRALNAAAYPHLEAILQLEAELQQQRATSPDVGEAVRAFLEKRPPVFPGD